MNDLKEILFQACERELNRYHSATDVELAHNAWVANEALFAVIAQAGLANEYAEWEMKRLRTRDIP